MEISSVCVFKSEDKAYADSFHSIGLAAFFVEPLSFRFVNSASIEGYARDPSLISGIIATSQNALKALEMVFGNAMGSAKGIRRHKVFAVGPGTAKKAEKMGFSSVFVPEKKAFADSADLAKFVVDYSADSSASAASGENKPFLVLSSNIRTPTLTAKLRQNDINFVEITAYETEPNKDLTRNKRQTERISNSAWLAFFSPSGCDAVFGALPALRRSLTAPPPGPQPRPRVAAIGMTTAAHLATLCVAVDAVAETADCEGLARAVKNAAQPQPQKSRE